MTCDVAHGQHTHARTVDIEKKSHHDSAYGFLCDLQAIRSVQSNPDSVLRARPMTRHSRSERWDRNGVWSAAILEVRGSSLLAV